MVLVSAWVLVFAVGLLSVGGIQLEVGADVAAPESAADHLSKLLLIRAKMDALYSPLITQSKHIHSDLHDLGEDVSINREPHTRTTALVLLEKTLHQFETPSVGDHELLGEPMESTTLRTLCETHNCVDEGALQKLMDIRSISDTTAAVRRLVEFLKAARAKNEALTRAELDQVRQFYIDQTAETLSRYGFEQSPYGHPDNVALRKNPALTIILHSPHSNPYFHPKP